MCWNGLQPPCDPKQDWASMENEWTTEIDSIWEQIDRRDSPILGLENETHILDGYALASLLNSLQNNTILNRVNIMQTHFLCDYPLILTWNVFIFQTPFRIISGWTFVYPD